MGKYLVASNTGGKDQSRAGKGQKIRGSVGLVSYYPCSFSWNRHNSFTMDCDSTYCRTKLMELTEDAASTLKHYMEKESPVPEYVRFGVKAGGCSGFTYTIGFDRKHRKFDLEFKTCGMKLLVDKKSHLYVKNTTIGWSNELQDKGFKFDNPFAKGSCGCRTSFMIDMSAAGTNPTPNWMN